MNLPLKMFQALTARRLELPPCNNQLFSMASFTRPIISVRHGQNLRTKRAIFHSNGWSEAENSLPFPFLRISHKSGMCNVWHLVLRTCAVPCRLRLRISAATRIAHVKNTALVDVGHCVPNLTYFILTPGTLRKLLAVIEY
ncbi:hypothetical protein GDO78_002773 [Eleutherodactylus coqui]|uniref:Uncharacterized protein n=1 Tax=Eleutherodactylus coqui TaxID=57060 RepID=A0A8J6K3M6_ELECQ|nr:hypothetical protein GDO78_002773 [Eleutherodactylus coqui]